MYVNDSKATNLDALEKALASETRPVILIAGGKDKGFEFSSLAEVVAEHARWVVLIGEMAERIAASWRDHLPCEKVGSPARSREHRLVHRSTRRGGSLLAGYQFLRHVQELRRPRRPVPGRCAGVAIRPSSFVINRNSLTSAHSHPSISWPPSLLVPGSNCAQRVDVFHGRAPHRRPWDDPPEPTMRLSRAILVMLLLHVVAVGGFFASSVLKERDLKRLARRSDQCGRGRRRPGYRRRTRRRHAPAKVNVRSNVHVVRPGETLTLIANETGVSLEALVAANGADTVTNGLRTGQELKLPEHSPEPVAVSGSTDSALNLIEGRTKPPVSSNAGPSSMPRSSHQTADAGKVYVVGKGESAYTIAQKNKVSYEALLKLNQIADPKKIQPGQKLRLPLPANKLNPK